MQVRIRAIFDAIQPGSASYSEARRILTMSEASLAGHLLTGSLSDIVEVDDGDILAIGEHRWRFHADKPHLTESWSLVKYPLWSGEGEGTQGIDDNEVHVPVGDGSTWLIFPSSDKRPEGVDYVRFADAKEPHVERLYWNFEEWKAEPVAVMGAIMACIQNGVDEKFAAELRA